MILDRYGNPYRYIHASYQDARRGPVYPTRAADIDRLVSAGDARILRSLSGRLYSNMGVPKACLNQIADYSVGEAWLPTYVGATDMPDGKLIANRLRTLWFPSCDVRGGCFDWWKLLELTSIAMDRDGDAFWLLVRGADNFPRIQMIPAHRVASGPDAGVTVVKNGKWLGYRIYDGVITYRSGRVAAYRVMTGENMDGYVDVDAADMIQVFDPEYVDQTRGMPKFSHAIQDLAACIASMQDERTRMQIISRMYLTIFNEAGGPDLDDPSIAMRPGTPNTSELTYKDIPGGITYMTAGTGEKIEQIRHENPGQEWENLNDRLIRIAIIGAGWSYSVWKPSGQGTAERSEVVKMRRTITRRQKQLRYAALRALSWAYSVFQQNGQMPLLDSPFAWSFSKPPRLSVDDGRESKMELDEWRAGTRNTDEILEARGLTTDEFDERRARIIANRKVAARKIAEEISASSGYEITIEDREMAMMTPNEVTQAAQTDAPDPVDAEDDPNAEDNTDT